MRRPAVVPGRSFPGEPVRRRAAGASGPCARTGICFGHALDTSKSFIDATVDLPSAWEEHLDGSVAERASEKLKRLGENRA